MNTYQKTILLTGFEPFGGETINPSWETAQAVEAPAGVKLLRLRLPVVFSKAGGLIAAAIDEYKPDAVLSLGQAGGRTALCLERVAINLNDSSSPDNEGDIPDERPVVPGGPAAYFSTLPVKAMVKALSDQGLPAAVSNSAGAYVCNHVMYTSLHHIATHRLPSRAGFLHIPYLPEQVKDRLDVFSLPMEEQIRALRICLEALR